MDNIFLFIFFFYHSNNSFIYYELIKALLYIIFIIGCFENKFLKIAFLILIKGVKRLDLINIRLI